MRNSVRSLFIWERDFTQSFLRLAVPIVIQSLVTASLHVVDNVMVGQLGEVEMAAVTQANRFTFVYQMTLFGLCGGTAVFAAQFWGKRDLTRIQQVLGLALMTAGLFAALFAVIAVALPGVIIRLLLQDEAAIALSMEYLRIVGIGYLFQALTQVYATVLKSTEQPKLPMAASIIAILLNTVLNYGLIFGRLGFPCLGVRGAAIATLVATVLEAVLVIGGSYCLGFATAAKLRALVPKGRAFVSKYIRITGTVVANESLWAVGISLYSMVYGHMGTGVVAAISIYNTVEQLGYAFTRGVNSAASVLVGKRLGQGRNEEAYFVSKRMMIASFAVSALAGLALFVGSDAITLVFRGVSAPVAADAARIIRISAIFIPLHGLNSLIIVGILRAGGDALASLLLDTGTVWVIGVPLVALAGMVLGLDIAQVIAIAQIENAVKLGLGIWRFRSKRWMNNLTISKEGGDSCNQGAN